ncbi:CHAD domain-containing protein [Halobacillus mangrovi]|uniref:CHAD domain-containing protein n=1 Tax=Halobacillus mangrovi TaxID=402384 RepID=UPI003D95796F
MSETFTRQIDTMGRLVIPKEVREQLELLDESLKLEPLRNKKGIKLSITNEEGEAVKTLDSNGRLLIPADYRKELGWNQEKKIDITFDHDYAILQDQIQVCEICHSSDALVSVKKSLVCEDCLGEGNEQVVDRWREQLKKLVTKYLKYCELSLEQPYDEENVHQARVNGRKVRAILEFIQVTNHPLLDRLNAAHKRLGKVRQRDVFIEEFDERAKQASKKQHEEVYRQLSDQVGKKRLKQQKKLNNKLPTIIDETFKDTWDFFKEKELRYYVLPLQVDVRIQEFENRFTKAVENYLEVVSKHHYEDEETLDALHSVRIISKKIRYINNTLHKIYASDYKQEARYFKSFQKQLGEINDLKDWLKMFDQYRDDIDSKKKHKKEVYDLLSVELSNLMDDLHLEESLQYTKH